MSLPRWRPCRTAAVWLCLALLAGLLLIYFARMDAANYFSRFHDDTVFFSSAKSLAEGRGYLIPSLPGTPPQSKYPVLYSWILSWVWKWNPSFPANVRLAVWVTGLFSCWFLVGSFLLLRSMRGLEDWRALLCAGLGGFHPIVVFLSGAVMSDVPFMALAITALWLADRAVDDRRPRWALACAALTSLALLTRTVGLALVAGIGLLFLFRRAWRASAILSLVVAPVLGATLWWSISHTVAAQAASTEPGWRQTWAYYTSYLDYWRASIYAPGDSQAMFSYNLKEWLQAPAALCLFPTPGGDRSMAGTLLQITFSAGILVGVIRQARADRWRAVHLSFVFYSAILLVVNYAIMDRYLLLFLPLFYAGLWVEGRHLSQLIAATLRSRRPFGEKAVAVLLALASLVGAGVAVHHYLFGLRPHLGTLARRRAALTAEKREAYQWIRERTAPDARFVSYQDVDLYLHTGRQAMRPLEFATAIFYVVDPKRLADQVAHFTDVGRRIGARYWLVAESDYDMTIVSPVFDRRIQELRSALPRLFESSGRRVEIYDLSCLQEPEAPRCRNAAQLLLAERTGSCRPDSHAP